jgi:hypothetical protein
MSHVVLARYTNTNLAYKKICDDPAGSREAAFDSDVLAFFDTKSKDGSWVGLDFSSPV